MRSVTLKSAITPSFMGRMATILPGVRPSISLASRPTATTSPLVLLMATMEGSFTTMPLPLANTSVLAVPRSMARSDDSRLKTDRKLYPFLLVIAPLRNQNGYALDGRATPAILADDHDFVVTARERLGEITEAAVGPDVGHGFSVDNQCSRGLRMTDQLDDIA